VANFVGRAIGLALVWVVVAALAVTAARAILPHGVARYVGWAVGCFAVAWMWRYWHRRGIEIDAERRESELAAGEKLRREDLPAYRALLDGATDTLAFADSDRYVGGIVTAPAEPRRYAWHPPTGAQRAAVERLTEELENATLVRTVDHSAAEVLGIKDDVAYRYRVDSTGAVTFLSTDDSKVRVLRTFRRFAVIGFLLFIGSFVPLVIWHRDGSVPGWLAPFMLVGFVMMFVGMAANPPGPNVFRFLDPGERWQEEGSGWNVRD
jgi:hypothetical protein